MEDRMVKVYINGQLAVSMKAAFKMDSSMVKAHGGRTKTISQATNTQVNTAWTKSTGMVNSPGNQEMCTKGITIKMKGMVMGKCTLQMEPCIKVIGNEDCKQVDQP